MVGNGGFAGGINWLDIGCSTGGRQGLKEIQQLPETFDGVIVGAPAWWTTHLNPYLAWDTYGVSFWTKQPGNPYAFNESLIELAEQTDPGNATADDFEGTARYGRKKRGKVLLYHGMANGLVPMNGTLILYNETVGAFRKQEELEEVASYINDEKRNITEGGTGLVKETARAGAGIGIGIGRGTNAPWYFGAALQKAALSSQPAPRDKDDIVNKTIDWVGRGKPIDKIVAGTWKDAMDPASGGERVAEIERWREKDKGVEVKILGV
ncbi:hypothetical protein QBC43DRAFT_336483 [Cladorrhinum sp. PSN259]|nr:hypothetical protein QBC43DRAFT_336483 [Cladorrhinum sp. PSN259]